MSQVRPARRPTRTAGTITTDSAGPLSKVKEAKATGPVPGRSDPVVDAGVRAPVGPPALRAAEPLGTGHGEAGDLAPPDESGVVADPGVAAGRRQEVEQRSAMPSSGTVRTSQPREVRGSCWVTGPESTALSELAGRGGRTGHGDLDGPDQAVARCNATIPPLRLRHAGRFQPAAAMRAASSGCVGQARIDSARYT